jgi:hypothetical protein
LRSRSPGSEPGDDDWQRPGLSLSWLIENGERPIGPGNWLLPKEPTESWTTLQSILDRPADVTGLKITFNAIGWTGAADFDDITVEPL